MQMEWEGVMEGEREKGKVLGSGNGIQVLLKLAFTKGKFKTFHLKYL